jgi:hypothetical protein
VFVSYTALDGIAACLEAAVSACCVITQELLQSTKRLLRKAGSVSRLVVHDVLCRHVLLPQLLPQRR